MLSRSGITGRINLQQQRMIPLRLPPANVDQISPSCPLSDVSARRLVKAEKPRLTYGGQHSNTNEGMKEGKKKKETIV